MSRVAALLGFVFLLLWRLSVKDAAVAETLTGKQRRHLRALGHNLQPVIQLGKEGMTESFLSAIEQAILDHELIKIRIGQNVIGDRKVLMNELSKKTNTHVAQVMGSTALLYRAHPKKPVIVLPKSGN